LGHILAMLGNVFVHFAYVLVAFFFYYSVHIRDLHSFPTRRSSDLNLLDSVLASREILLFLPEPKLDLSTGSPAKDNASILLLTRSEEHTSELQSLAYLVCRLLLEKKKKTLNKRLNYCTCSSHTRNT